MNKMRESFESSSIFTQYYSDEHEFSGDMYQNSFLQSDYIKFCEGYQAALAQANVNEQSQAQKIQWISVEERLPEENCHVLVACEGGNVATTFYAIDHSFFDHAHGHKLSRKVHGKYSKHFELARQYGYRITHWMPLAAPEGDDK